MSDPNFAIFASFLNAFRGLADPDQDRTLAAIKPIMGDQVNASTLRLVGKFLTELFYESVESPDDSYVCLRGRRIPISAFTDLQNLVTSTPPGMLSTLADGLASMQTDAHFPMSFVPKSILKKLEFVPLSSANERIVEIAKERLYKAYTGGSTVSDLVAERRFASPVSGDGHASS